MTRIRMTGFRAIKANRYFPYYKTFNKKKEKPLGSHGLFECCGKKKANFQITSFPDMKNTSSGVFRTTYCSEYNMKAQRQFIIIAEI